MPQYRVLRDTWISHKGFLAVEGTIVDLHPLPKVPKYEKGQLVLGKDGKPELVEMSIGSNFEPVEDDKPVKAKKVADTPLA